MEFEFEKLFFKPLTFVAKLIGLRCEKNRGNNRIASFQYKSLSSLVYTGVGHSCKTNPS